MERLIAVYNLAFGKKHINSSNTFIIAEIGNNHNGNLERAIEMIDQVKNFGADCVKFQMRNLPEVYRERSLHKKGDDLGTEYVLDLLKNFELNLEQHRTVMNYCKQVDIEYLCTPWDNKSVNILESFGVHGYKVASADLTNIFLLEKLSKTNKPLIISTGMSTQEEIEYTVEFLNERSVSFILLHCNSTYPAPLYDINLNFMKSLFKIHPLVGYSGHERGINTSLAAVALGACVIERHFTLDRAMEGPDHAASLTSLEFEKLIIGVKEVKESLGEETERSMTQGEMINRENLAKSLVSTKDLQKGTTIEPSHVKIRSPGQGISPQKYNDLLGSKLKRDMKKEDFFYQTDVNETVIEPRRYSFNRPWGVPVRYHDFIEYKNKIEPDLWEFHFSYSDLNLDHSKFLEVTKSTEFIVHAPELFENSVLMDLTSPDQSYRDNSIFETQRVINITKELKEYFPTTIKPLIVANVGGFSMDKPLSNTEKNDCYLRLADSLDQLNTEGVEVIPQTMAPFPWHFGGQRYQNIFIESEEIIKWCDEFNMRICFDVSHSKLACNYLKKDFYKFSCDIAKYTAHIHVGDAQKFNGEGLQIGEGGVDFKRLFSLLNKAIPGASFIPEIWQGHKNGGEGFWIALDKLEGLI